MTDNQHSKQVALERILSVLAKGSSKAIQYSTFLVGIVALLPGVNLPPEMGSLVAISLNSISSLIDRVASDNKISDDEIKIQVEMALQKSGIDKLIEKDDFYHAFALLQKNQRANHKEHELILQTLQKLIPSDTEPLLPSVNLETYSGLSFPEGTKITITSEMCQKWRQHEFSIKNENNFELHNISFRIQLPEPLMAITNLERPAGVEFLLSPDLMEFESMAGGGGSVTFQGNRMPTGVWKFELGKLPARKSAKFTFITSNDSSEQHYSMMQSDLPDFSSKGHANRLQFFLEGEFQFNIKGEYPSRNFISPFLFDRENRRLSAMKSQSDFGNWTPIYIEFG